MMNQNQDDSHRAKDIESLYAHKLASTAAGSEEGKSCSSTPTIACSMKREWLWVSFNTVTSGRPISSSHLAFGKRRTCEHRFGRRGFATDQAVEVQTLISSQPKERPEQKR